MDSSEQLLNQVYWLYTKPAKLSSVGRSEFGTEGLEARPVQASASPAQEDFSTSMNDSVCDVVMSRGSDCAAVCGSQVMIIGNHSAGKSSFVNSLNWYVDEDIQPTGKAVYTLVLISRFRPSMGTRPKALFAFK
jgi:hypothetical protein